MSDTRDDPQVAPQAPGWYPHPTNPAVNRYWTGHEWLIAPTDAPAADDRSTTPPAVPDESLTPGWYTDPNDPTRSQYWDGKRLGGIRDSKGEPVLPQAIRDAEAKQSNKAFLWTNYILGALVPLWGVIAAIYLAVSEKRAAIRRHAIGIGAVALLAAGVYTVIIVSANSAHQDRNVGADLQNLLSQHNILATNVNCAHQSGNQYQCSATINGQQQFATVTDDGTSIYEQGINAGG